MQILILYAKWTKEGWRTTNKLGVTLSSRQAVVEVFPPNLCEALNKFFLRLLLKKAVCRDVSYF